MMKIRCVKRHRRDEFSFCDYIFQQKIGNKWVDIDLSYVKNLAEWETEEDKKGYEDGHKQDMLAFEEKYPIDDNDEE
jgi:hypothetical protein